MGSAALGWASAAEEKPDAETARLLSLHRWMGLGVAVAAPLLALVSIRARRTSSRAIVHGYRAALWACVALVSTAAHYGGMLVYGEGYISSAWAPPAPGPVAPRSPLPPATAASVVFERDIAPIFRAHCIKCHGPEKQKGKYRLDSRELALKGGESGKVIVPGSAKDSPLYLLLLEKEAEDRMPPKDNPLTAEKIELIRAWIDQGADWPDLKQSSAPKTGGP
jgi:mono/diheme cytochrome c family protein